MAVTPTAEVRVRTVTDRASLRRTEAEITKSLAKVEQLASKGGLLSKAYTQPLGKITGAVGEFEKSLEASNARVIAFGASAGIIYNVTRAIESMTRSAIMLEHKLAEINVILNASSSGLKKFGDQLFDIAKNTGQTFDDVANSALEFARQGLAVEETLKRTSDAMVLVRLAGLDVQSSVEAVTATINSFNQTIISSTELVNKLANVDAAFAVSSADLAKAISRVGSSAQDAGVGLDELIAMTTTAQQVTARGGSVIGNSLKTIFTRIQRPAVISNLEAFGVAVRDAQGATLPAIQVLKNFADAYGSMSAEQRAVSAEMVGGVFQVNVLKAAIGDLGKQFSIYDRALHTSVSSTDEAIQRNAALNKTLKTLTNETLVNLLKVGAKVGEITIAPTLRSTLEGVNKTLEDMQENADAEKIGSKLGKGVLEGIGSILKGPGMIILGALVGKLFYSFSKFSTDAVKTFAGWNEGAKKQAEMQMLIQNILLKNPDLIDAAASSEQAMFTIEKKILEVIKSRNLALAQSADLSAKMAGNLSVLDLKAINVAVGASGATEGSWRPVASSHGLIPNFNSKKDRSISEAFGAIRGGYKPGAIKEMNVQGVGRVTYNSAETVKKFDGMAQPAIMPPQQSEAGKAYKDKFKNTHGFDPYASGGLIPNFGRPSVTEVKAQSYYKGNKPWGSLQEFEKNKYRMNYISDLYDKVTSGNSLKSVAKKEGVSERNFFNWIKHYDQKIGALYPNPSVGNNPKTKSLVELIRQKQTLRAKNTEEGREFEDQILDYFGLPRKAQQNSAFDFVGATAINRSTSKNISDLKNKIGLNQITNLGDAHYSDGHGPGLFISKYLRHYAASNQVAENLIDQLFSGDYSTKAKALDVSVGRGGSKRYTDIVGDGIDSYGTQVSTINEVSNSWVALKQALIKRVGGTEMKGKKLDPKGKDNRKRLSAKDNRKYLSLKYAVDDIDPSKLNAAQGFIPNFATKILDKDQLAQHMGMPLSSKEVKAVFDEIVNRAIQGGQIAETIIGTAGIGKTTEAIRKAGGKNFITNASQLNPSDQLVVVRAAHSIIDSPEIANASKLTFLKGSKEVVKGMRKKRADQIRAGVSDTGFGRAASAQFGSTSGILTEALLAEKYAGKLSVFERQTDMSLKKMNEFEKINELKGTTAVIGAFSPFTVGHSDMAEKAGASVAFVAKGANREFDIGLSPSEKSKLIELANPNMMAIPSAAGIQQHFEHGGKAYRMKKGDTYVGLGADRVDGGPEDMTAQFSSYKGVKPVHGRLGGVSGTKLRQAIVSGNAKIIKDNLPAPVANVILKNIPVLQERARLIQQRKDHAAKGLQILEEEKASFASRHGARKKKGELQEITEARQMFSKRAKEYKRRMSGYGGAAWSRLGLGLNFAAEGFVPSFAYEGLHEKDFGTVMMGRKGATGKNMTDEQVKKATAGMRLIRGPENETLIVGSDMHGRANRMIATGLTARKIKKSGPHWRVMLDQVPHLFDGLAYDLPGGIVGAKYTPSEGMTAAMQGVEFENQFAAKHGLPKAGAKKGSDFSVSENLVKQLKTKPNLQLKLALHERSKRDKTKVVDIASSFSKYLVDVLTHNIKTYGLSSVTTPDRFQQAMGVLEQNPAVKKDWVKYFGEMGTRSEGLVPNFARDALRSAVEREKAAGQGQPRIGFDRRLKKSGGIGVYNTTEGSLANAINLHIKSGKSISDIQTQGASQGFTPNFASDSLDSAMMMGSLSMVAFTLKDVGSSFKELWQNTEGTADQIKDLEKKEADARKEMIAGVEAATKALLEKEAEIKSPSLDKAEATAKEFSATAADSEAEFQARKGELELANVALGEASNRVEKADIEAANALKLKNETLKGVNVDSFADANRMKLAKEAGYEGDEGGVHQWLASAEGIAATGGRDARGRNENLNKLEEMNQESLQQLNDRLDEKVRLAEENLKAASDELNARQEAADAILESAEAAENKAATDQKLAETAEKELKEEKKKHRGKVKEGTKAERDAKAKALREGRAKTRAAEDRTKKASAKRGMKARVMGFVESGGAASMIAGAPMLASMGSQFIDDKNLRDKAKVEGVGNALGMAATGLQMGQAGGPIGMAIGAVAGLGIGAITLSDNLAKAKIREKMEEVGKEAEEMGDKLNKVTAGGQAYMDSLDKLDKLMKDTSGNVSADDIAKVRSKMTQALSEVPVEFQQRFKAAAGDAEKIKEIFGEITEELTKTKNDLDAAKMGYELQEKFGSGERGWSFWSSDTTMFERSEGGRLSGEGRRVQAQMKQAISLALKKGDLQKAVDQGMDIDFSKMSNMQKFTGEGFGALLENLQGNVDNADIQHISKLMQEVFDRMKEGSKISAAAQAELRKKNALDKIYLQQQKALNRAIEDFNTIVGKSVEGLKSRLFTIQQLTENTKKFTIDYAREDVKGARGLEGEFLSKGAKVRAELIDKSFDIKTSSLVQFRKAVSEGTKKNLEAFVKKFSDLNAKVIRQTAGLAEKSGKEQLGELARNRKAQQAMIPVMEEAFSVWASAPNDLKAMTSVTQKMAGILRNNGIAENKAESAAKLLLEEIKQNGASTVNELATAIQQRNQQLEIAERQAYWAERSAQLQERIASFGGQGEIFGDSGMAGLSKSFEGMSRSLESQIKGAVSSSIVDIGRANAQLLDQLINKMNFDQLRDIGPGIAPLLGSAIAGRTEDINRQVGFARRVSGIVAPGMQLPEVNAEKIATEQIAAQLKLNQMPDDIAEIRKNSEILNRLVALQTNRVVDANEEAFDKALKLNGIPQNMRSAALGTQVTAKATDNVRKSVKENVLKAGYQNDQQINNVRMTNELGFANLIGASSEVQAIAAALPQNFAQKNGLALAAGLGALQTALTDSMGNIGTNVAEAMATFKDPIKELESAVDAQKDINIGNNLINALDKANKASANDAKRTLELNEEMGYLVKFASATYDRDKLFGVTNMSLSERKYKDQVTGFGDGNIATFLDQAAHAMGNIDLNENSMGIVKRQRFSNETIFKNIREKLTRSREKGGFGVEFSEETGSVYQQLIGLLEDAVDKNMGGLFGWDYSEGEQKELFAGVEKVLKTASENQLKRIKEERDAIRNRTAEQKKANDALVEFRENLKKNPLDGLGIRMQTEWVGSEGGRFKTKSEAEKTFSPKQLAKGIGPQMIQFFATVTKEQRKAELKAQLKQEADKATLSKLGIASSPDVTPSQALASHKDNLERRIAEGEAFINQQNSHNAEKLAAKQAEITEAEKALKEAKAREEIWRKKGASSSSTAYDLAEGGIPRWATNNRGSVGRPTLNRNVFMLAQGATQKAQENLNKLKAEHAEIGDLAGQVARNLAPLREELAKFKKVVEQSQNRLLHDTEERLNAEAGGKAGTTIKQAIEKLWENKDDALVTPEIRTIMDEAKKMAGLEGEKNLNAEQLEKVNFHLRELLKNRLTPQGLARIAQLNTTPGAATDGVGGINVVDPRTRGGSKDAVANAEIFMNAIKDKEDFSLEQIKAAAAKLKLTLDATNKELDALPDIPDTFEQWVYDNDLEYLDKEVAKKRYQQTVNKRNELQRTKEVLKSEGEALDLLDKQKTLEQERKQLLKDLNLRNIDINKALADANQDSTKIRQLIDAYGDLQRDIAQDNIIKALAEAHKKRKMSGKSADVVGQGGFDAALFGAIGETRLKERQSQREVSVLAEIRNRRRENMQSGGGMSHIQNWIREITNEWAQGNIDEDRLTKLGLLKDGTALSEKEIKDWAIKNQDNLMSILNDPALKPEQYENVINAIRKLFDVMTEEEAIRLSLENAYARSNDLYEHQLQLFEQGIGTYEALNTSFQNLKKSAKDAGKLIDQDTIQKHVAHAATNVGITFVSALNDAMAGAASGDSLKSSTDSYLKQVIENPEMRKFLNDDGARQKKLDELKTANLKKNKARADRLKTLHGKIAEAEKAGGENKKKNVKAAEKAYKRAKRDHERLSGLENADEAAFSKPVIDQIKEGQLKTLSLWSDELQAANKILQEVPGNFALANAAFNKLNEAAKQGLFDPELINRAKDMGVDPAELFIEENLLTNIQQKSKLAGAEVNYFTAAVRHNAIAASEGTNLLNKLKQEYIELSDAKGYDKGAAIDRIRETVNARAKAYNKELRTTAELYKEGLASSDQFRKAIEDANQAAMDAGKYGIKNFTNSMLGGFLYNAQDFYKDLDSMGKEFSQDFRTGMAGAFGEAIRGTKDLSSAFGDMLAKMADKMLDRTLQMGVNSIFNAVMPNPQGFSTGGMVRGGSGTKDDVPAYLSKGEYVIRKSSVDAYGKDFFDSLNTGKITQANEGGLIKLAIMRRAEARRQRELEAAGIKQFSYREADGEAKKKDWLGRETDKPIMHSKSDYRLDVGTPISSERLKSIKEVLKRYPDVAKNMDREMLDESTLELGQGKYKAHLKNRFIFDNLKRPENAIHLADARLSASALTDENNPQNRFKFEKMDAFFGYQNERMSFLKDRQKQMEQYERQKQGRRYGFLFGGASLLLSAGLTGGKGMKLFAKGGQNDVDNIPALLTGGEYVINKGIVDKYGTEFFDRLNNGTLAKYATGGLVTRPHTMSPVNPSAAGTGQMGGVGGSMDQTNNISITVNVDAVGNVTNEVGEVTGSEAGLTESESKELANRIKSTVLSTLVQEKKPGGMLYK